MNELDEMRVKIAGELGWTNVHMTKRLGLRGKRTAGDFTFDDAVPDWTGDLAVAWRLLQYAQMQHVGFDISNANYAGTDVWKFAVTLFDPIGGPYSTEYQVEAQTLPEAICRAWLAWKQQEGK